MPLYEVAIIHRASEAEIKEGKPSETLVLKPTPVIASNKESAIVVAVREATLEQDNLERLEVLVRPFG